MTRSALDSPRKRGRPRKAPAAQESRAKLLRAGLVHLTERGYSPVSVDEILASADVPKGSFYYHFKSKADFGAAAIDAYQDYFAAKLDRWFGDGSLSPLSRLRAFTTDAEQGMARHDFTRGCLVGNLGQEMAALPEPLRQRLRDVLADWERRTTLCLTEARDAAELDPSADPEDLARLFWIGWEGAVLRAKLERNGAALRLFAHSFFILAERRPA